MADRPTPGPHARHSMRADEIVAVLEEPLDDRRAVIAVLHDRASVRALAKALRMTHDPATRRIVSDVLRVRAEAAPLAAD